MARAARPASPSAAKKAAPRRATRRAAPKPPAQPPLADRVKAQVSRWTGAAPALAEVAAMGVERGLHAGIDATAALAAEQAPALKRARTAVKKGVGQAVQAVKDNPAKALGVVAAVLAVAAGVRNLKR